MDLKKRKETKRIKYKEIRDLEVKKIGKRIYLEVLNTINKLTSENNYTGFIGIYWPIQNEVDLRGLKNFKELALALPCCKNSTEISFHPWTEDSLQGDFCGIPSPLCNSPLQPNEIDLLLVPALAIDLEGFRLGYGGGYFDRLRSNYNWRDIQALTVLPEACISNNVLPRNHWDIPFDGWISEKGFNKIK